MTPVTLLPVDLRSFRSALVVKPSSLGDIVHTLPAVRLLKQAHPQLTVRWIANNEWMPLLAGCPFVDEVVPFPRQRFRGLGGALRSLAWAAKWNRTPRETPEIVLDFQGLLRSGLVAFARGADCVVGLSDSREGAWWFHDHVIAVDPSAHAVDRNLAMPRAFGMEFGAGDIRFDLPAGEKPEGWTEADDFILLHPFSRGAGKSLELAALQTLCDCLGSRRVVIVGMADRPAAVRGAHVRDLTNRTSLLELVWLMRHARACISVDSGPMHIAAAVNERSLGIHTWTDPRRVGPYDLRACVWKAGRIAHRHELSDDECAKDLPVTEPDARRIADFVLGTVIQA